MNDKLIKILSDAEARVAANMMQASFGTGQCEFDVRFGSARLSYSSDGKVSIDQGVKSESYYGEFPFRQAYGLSTSKAFV